MKVFSVRSKQLFFTVCVCVCCLKIIGLAPFSVPIGKPARINPYASRVQVFFVSEVGLIYNLLLLITVSVLPWYYIPHVAWQFDLTTSIMTDFMSAIAQAGRMLAIVANCLNIITWAFKQKSATRVMNRLLEVDVRLSGLRKRPFNKQALIFLTLHIILNACLWITFSVVIITYIKVDNLPAEFIARIPDFLVHWFFMEYIAVVGLVSRDLETVNKYLLDFKQFGSYLSRPPIRNGVLIVNVSNNSSSQVASLKLLRGVRTTLYELCGEIADFFSFPILFCIACYFIPIFQQLYKLSQIIDSLTPVETASYILILVLKNIYPIISLTLNVTRTKKEARLTGNIVHKLLAEARTEEIKAELKQFSLQLLHEEVDFTAYGLFTLDSTLLQSMLAGVASYIIILMQFGSSNCNCKDTSAE